MSKTQHRFFEVDTRCYPLKCEICGSVFFAALFINLYNFKFNRNLTLTGFIRSRDAVTARRHVLKKKYLILNSDATFIVYANIPTGITYSRQDEN